MNEEVLDLDTVIVRPTVRIRWGRHKTNGKLYELVDVSDLAIVQHAKIVALAGQVDELNNVELTKKLTVKQIAQRDKALRDVVALLLPTAERAALNALSNGQCEAVLATWSANTAKKKGGAGGPPRTRRSTTAR
jgi:hypothetical protein